VTSAGPGLKWKQKVASRFGKRELPAATSQVGEARAPACRSPSTKFWGIERRESGAPGEFAEIENMTAEELEAFIASELETYRRGRASQAVN
jgi:hypothetical protein